MFTEDLSTVKKRETVCSLVCVSGIGGLVCDGGRFTCVFFTCLPHTFKMSGKFRTVLGVEEPHQEVGVPTEK